jgi:hypothetical protein
MRISLRPIFCTGWVIWDTWKHEKKRGKKTWMLHALHSFFLFSFSIQWILWKLKHYNLSIFYYLPTCKFIK